MEWTGKLRNKWGEEKEKLAAGGEKPPVSAQRRALSLLVRFFALMLVFTLFSRAADGLTMPRVTECTAAGGKLTYRALCDGVIKSGTVQTEAIPAGLRVTEVLAKEGERVTKDAPLLRFDTDGLSTLIAQKEAELTKARAAQKSGLAQSRLGLSEKQNAVANAREDIADAKKLAADAQSRAQRNLEDAKATLSKLEAGLEAEVKKSCEERTREAQEAYDDALSALEQARNAHKQAYVSQNAVVEDAKRELENAEDAEDDVLIQEAKRTLRRAQDTRKAMFEGLNTSIQYAERKEQAAKQALFDAQLQTTEEDIREAAQKQIDTAKQTQTQAQDALDDAVRSGQEQADTAERALETAQEAYEQQKVRDEEDNAGRRTEEVSLAEMEKALEKLYPLQNRGGVVNAPASGSLSRMDYKAGAASGDGDAFSIATGEGGGVFKGSLPKEDAKRFSVGEPVNLTVPYGGEQKSYEAVLRTLGEPDEKGVCEVTVKLPADAAFTDGQSASLEAKKDSERFQLVVPMAAVRTDGGGSFVLVLREKTGVLGTELTAEQVGVTVDDRNETSAAVTGALSYGDRIIVSSTRSVSHGDRVRPEA